MKSTWTGVDKAESGAARVRAVLVRSPTYPRNYKLNGVRLGVAPRRIFHYESFHALEDELRPLEAPTWGRFLDTACHAVQRGMR